MRLIIRTFIIFNVFIFSSCQGGKKSRYYYNENDYILIDSAYNQEHTEIIRRVYVNKNDNTRILTKIYSGNGMLYGKAFYHNGKMEGPFIYYYPGESKIWFKGHHKNDSLDGKIISYYENGTVHKIRYFDVGKELGVWKIFDSTGQLIDSIVH